MSSPSSRGQALCGGRGWVPACARTTGRGAGVTEGSWDERWIVVPVFPRAGSLRGSIREDNGKGGGSNGRELGRKMDCRPRLPREALCGGWGWVPACARTTGGGGRSGRGVTATGAMAVRWNLLWYGVEGMGWFVSYHVFSRYVEVTFLNGASLRPVPPGSGKARTRAGSTSTRGNLMRSRWRSGSGRRRLFLGGTGFEGLWGPFRDSTIERVLGVVRGGNDGSPPPSSRGQALRGNNGRGAE